MRTALFSWDLVRCISQASTTQKHSETCYPRTWAWTVGWYHLVSWGDHQPTICTYKYVHIPVVYKYSTCQKMHAFSIPFHSRPFHSIPGHSIPFPFHIFLHSTFITRNCGCYKKTRAEHSIPFPFHDMPTKKCQSNMLKVQPFHVYRKRPPRRCS